MNQVKQNKCNAILEIFARTIVYVFINYLLVSTELSFKANLLGLLASLAHIFTIIEYFRSVKTLTGKKWIAVLCVILCVLISIGIACFFGYVQGTIQKF